MPKHITKMPLMAALKAAAGTALLMPALKANAALPTPTAPTGYTAAGTDYLGLIKAFSGQAGLILGLMVSVIGFIWIAYITIAKFNEARGGRAEWAEVGTTAVVAAGVMVFFSYCLTQASTIFV